MTVKELIERACEIANVGIDPAKSPDLESLAEPLISPVFNALAQDCAGDERRRLLTRLTKTVAFTNGAGSLSSDVLTTCLDDSVLTDDADLTAGYSYVREWDDFINTFDQRLGYYTVNQSTITVVQPNNSYVIGSGLTGNLSLLTPCVWAIPTDLVTNISIRDELLDDLVNRLGLALRGELEKQLVYA